MNARIAITKDAGRAPVKKAQRLTKIEVYEVSLVSTPAVPDATIAIMKSLDMPSAEGTVHKELAIAKIDAAKKQIYAYALVPEKEDRQGDIVSKEDVEAAKNSFFRNLALRNQKGSGIGGQHQVFEGIGYPIGGDIDLDGSYGRMLGIAAEKCIPGGWLLGIQVTDEEVWKKVEAGEITGISIGCLAERIELAAPTKTAPEFKRGAFRKLIDDMFKAAGYVRVRPTDKSIDFNSSYTMQVFYDECPDMWDALMSAFWSIMYDDLNHPTFESKMAAIEESLAQFATKIRELFGIEKGSKSKDDKVIRIIDKSGGEEPTDEGVLSMEITKAELQTMIAEAVNAAVEKALTEKAEETKKSLGDVASLSKSVTDLSAKLDKVAKGEEGELVTLVAKAIEKLHAAVVDMGKKVYGSNTLPEDESTKEKSKDVFKGTAFNFLG